MSIWDMPGNEKLHEEIEWEEFVAQRHNYRFSMPRLVGHHQRGHSYSQVDNPNLFLSASSAKASSV